MPPAGNLKATDEDIHRLTSLVEGIEYIRDFITPEEEKSLFGALDAQGWSNDINRRTQQYGAKFDYRTRGASRALKDDATSTVPPMPDFLQFIAKRLVERGVYAEPGPDQLIVNEYKAEQGIARHVDAINLWGPVVCTLSMGDPAVMRFAQSKRLDPEGKNVIDTVLEPRSLVVLKGPSRYEWQHEISRGVSFEWQGAQYTRGKGYYRVSLTFRTIKFVGTEANTDEGSQY